MTIQQAFDLAMQQQRGGNLGQAEAIYRQILAHQPDHAASNHMLGVIAMHTGKLDVAVDFLRQALAFNPTIAETYCELGNIFAGTGRAEQAIAFYRKSLSLQPDSAQCLNNFANALHERGEIDQALDFCRRALALQPDWPEIHSTMGNLLRDKGELTQAAASFRQALTLRPNFPDAMVNLANVLQDAGRIDEAISMFRGALALQPNLPEAHYNLGNALRDTGRIEEAIAGFNQSLALRPDNAVAHSNKIYAMHFHPAYDTHAICAELAKWNQQHAAPLAGLIQPHQSNRDPNRRLRIGYVSPDFREHVVGWNLLPLLTWHDHAQFEIFCYSSVLKPDVMTEKLKWYADTWRDIRCMNDDQAAAAIRADQIDILVDLSLHSAHHRLLLFARKPAPLQVTYLAYCSSTGLSAMDYRFSDVYMDREEEPNIYAEKTLFLPHSYWCYQPGMQMPEPGPLPAISNGYVTFGCLNQFAKVSDPALLLWAEILAAIPGSRLILHAPAGNHRQRVVNHFTTHGVAESRVEFVPKQTFGDYGRTYQRIDIVLDPFPHGGGITSCDALWMGVPVISLEGNTAVGRGGKSILSNLGLRRLLAQTPASYMQIALETAADLPRLAALRAKLRERMAAAPLMDAKSRARDVEAMYRKIWMDWCRL
jgi:predicted O-linked N-acetylglucosamine transferase (SPINDLY family)